MANFFLTFTELQDAVVHALGGTPNPKNPATQIVNRALNWMCKKRAWKWRQKPLSIDFVSSTLTVLSRTTNVVSATTGTAHGLVPGSTFRVDGCVPQSFNGVFVVATAPTTTTLTWGQAAANDAASTFGSVLPAHALLPTDFDELLALRAGVNSFSSCSPVGLDALLAMRQASAGAAFDTSFAVSWLSQTAVNAEPRAILELFPAPAFAQLAALSGMYLRRIPKLTTGTDIPDIPGQYHDLLLVLCRAMAVSTEEDQSGQDWQLFQSMFLDYAASDGMSQGPVVGRMASTIGRGAGGGGWDQRFNPNGRIGW